MRGQQRPSPCGEVGCEIGGTIVAVCLRQSGEAREIGKEKRVKDSHFPGFVSISRSYVP